MAGFMPGDKSLFGRLAMGSQPRVGGGDVQLPGEDGADMMGMMQALQQSQQAGLTRTATPFGSIMQNIMPIFGALVYAKAAEAQQAKAAAEAKQKADLVQSQIDLNNARAASAGGVGGKGPTNFENLAVQSLLKGDAAGFQQAMEAKKAMSMGGQPARPTLWSKIQEANPDATPQEQIQAWTKAQAEAQGQSAQARGAATEAILKPLPAKEAGKYSEMISELDNIDNLMAQMASRKTRPTKGSAALADWVPGGLLTNPFWRDYQVFYNKVAHEAYGTALSANESKNLAKALPTPSAYAADPEGFFTSLSHSRDRMAKILGKEVEIQNRSYKLGPELLDPVSRLTGAKGVEEGQAVETTGQKGTFMVPRGREAEARSMRDEIRKAGGSDADVMKAWAKEFGWKDFFVK